MAHGTEHGGAWLVCVAAPGEARAVLRGLGVSGGDHMEGGWEVVRASPGMDVVLTGVGKAAAAAGAVHAFDPGRHAGVLSLGVGGALPGSGLEIGDVVAARRSVYADEGLETPEGFVDLAAMGFGPAGGVGMGIENDEAAARALGTSLGGAVRRGDVACVSTCSGTDARAAAVAARTGAVCEAMEGAAIGFSVLRAGRGRAAFCEVRVISNTTGNRDAQVWALDRALDRLGEVAAALAASLGSGAGVE